MNEDYRESTKVFTQKDMDEAARLAVSMAFDQAITLIQTYRNDVVWCEPRQCVHRITCDELGHAIDHLVSEIFCTETLAATQRNEYDQAVTINPDNL